MTDERAASLRLATPHLVNKIRKVSVVGSRFMGLCGKNRLRTPALGESVCREGGESLLSTARTPYTDEPSTAASETERERVSKRHTPAVRTLSSRPQPRPSCHYLPSCSTASRNLAHSPARYSALSPFPSLVSSIGSPTYSLSLFPNSL